MERSASMSAVSIRGRNDPHLRKQVDSFFDRSSTRPVSTATEMFDTDFLRLDLEHPEQVILIPTKYNSQILMESDVEEVVAKMKERRDCFGGNKTRSLATETFGTNDILRFDLEHPEQAIIIPTRYNSRVYIERDVKEVVAKMKESGELFGETGRDKTLSHGQVRSTVLIHLHRGIHERNRQTALDKFESNDNLCFDVENLGGQSLY